MKRFLSILVLGLLLCSVGYAGVVKLSKDAASGYKKLFKSLTGNYYKDYYLPADAPTTIVYFNEVRKSRKREKVGIIKWIRIYYLNQFI